MSLRRLLTSTITQPTPVINVRSYGEDPADVARFAAAFTQGAQGAGVIATAKHFPGHGDYCS